MAKQAAGANAVTTKDEGASRKTTAIPYPSLFFLGTLA
jgi:hypothetical protein